MSYDNDRIPEDARGSVVRTVERLDKELAQFGEVIDSLQQRLEFVLRPDEPRPESGDGADKKLSTSVLLSSTATQRLEGILETIGRQRRQLTLLTERLDT